MQIAHGVMGQSVAVGLVRSSYFPLHARRVWRMAGFSASAAGVGAESALPLPYGQFSSLAEGKISSKVRCEIQIRMRSTSSWLTSSRRRSRFVPLKAMNSACKAHPNDG